jgi:hypothetical protein
MASAPLAKRWIFYANSTTGDFSEEVILFRQPIVPDFIFSASGQPFHQATSSFLALWFAGAPIASNSIGSLGHHLGSRGSVRRPHVALPFQRLKRPAILEIRAFNYAR